MSTCQLQPSRNWQTAVQTLTTVAATFTSVHNALLLVRCAPCLLLSIRAAFGP